MDRPGLVLAAAVGIEEDALPIARPHGIAVLEIVLDDLPRLAAVGMDHEDLLPRRGGVVGDPAAVGRDIGELHVAGSTGDRAAAGSPPDAPLAIPLPPFALLPP